MTDMKKKKAFSLSKEVQTRIDSGDIIEQKCWQYIKELNGTDAEKLDLVAVTDCKRKYTYHRMYEKWDQYARVFSALGITGDNGARAGVDGTACAEVSFAFFGLNMIGASVSVIRLSDDNRLKNLKVLVAKEHLTDLILTDYEVDPHFLRRLLREKDGMGIRNVILLHVPVCGAFAFPCEEFKSRMNHKRLRDVSGAVFMKDLIKKYRDHEICFAKEHCDDAAVIVHTSGTTEGVPKPVPLSDRAVNEFLRRHILWSQNTHAKGRMKTLLFNNLFTGSSFMSMLSPLASGGILNTLPMITPGVRYLIAIVHFRVTNIVFYSALIDLFTMIPVRPDLSSVQTVMLVGSYSSADTVKQFRKFFRECGSDANILVGYGMTEAGVGLILTTPDTKDGSVGHLLPNVKAKLWDEDEKRFYDMDGKSHTGVLYVSTPSLSSGRLDDDVIFELDEIDGEKYLNTNDLFTVREDGSFYYIGRTNRFFVNEKGVKFEAGLIERAVCARKGIKGCGIVPEYNKRIHETEPILYVETKSPGTGGYRIIKDALKQVYISEGLIDKTALPAGCVLTAHIPRTSTGKVDVHKITEGKVHGSTYRIKGVYENEKLKEIYLW